MPYPHFGKIGDIWKHLPLAEILKIEKPGKYIESNSASAIYTLSSTQEQKFGIYYFAENCRKSSILRNTEYCRIIRYFNPDCIKKYPGSPAIALNLLKESGCVFYFYDIEKEALDNILEYTGQLGITEQCRFFNEDSVSGISKLLSQLDNNSFIHFDPYDAFITESSGLTYLDLFFEAQKKGIKAMLWYGFMTSGDKKRIFERIKEKMNSYNKKNIMCIEVYLGCIKNSSVSVNPGVIGAGIITCNLGKKSGETIFRLSDELKSIYRGSVLFDTYKGDLETEKIEY